MNTEWRDWRGWGREGWRKEGGYHLQHLDGFHIPAWIPEEIQTAGDQLCKSLTGPTLGSDLLVPLGDSCPGLVGSVLPCQGHYYSVM